MWSKRTKILRLELFAEVCLGHFLHLPQRDGCFILQDGKAIYQFRNHDTRTRYMKHDRKVDTTMDDGGEEIVEARGSFLEGRTTFPSSVLGIVRNVLRRAGELEKDERTKER